MKLWRGVHSLTFGAGPDGIFVAASGKEVASLTAEYEVRWRAKALGLDRAVAATADVVVMASHKEGLRGLAAADGRLLWQVPSFLGWCHVVGQEVFTLRRDEKTLASVNLASGAPLREVALPGPPTGTPVDDWLLCALRGDNDKFTGNVTALSLDR